MIVYLDAVYLSCRLIFLSTLKYIFNRNILIPRFNFLSLSIKIFISSKISNFNRLGVFIENYFFLPEVTDLTISIKKIDAQATPTIAAVMHANDLWNYNFLEEKLNKKWKFQPLLKQ